MSTAHPPAQEPTTGAQPEQRSVGDLVSAVSADLTTLLRLEVELVKAEVRQSATKAGPCRCRNYLPWMPFCSLTCTVTTGTGSPRRPWTAMCRTITTPHASRRLQWRGFSRATGLRTGTAQTLTRGEHSIRITSLPGRHATGGLRRLLPPVMGSMLQFSTGGGRVTHQMYVSGDTLLVDELAEIPRRFPCIDTTVLHLGGTTLPGGFMVTMDARQGADLLELVSPSRGIPVHHSDYTVFKSPLSEFRDEVTRRGLHERVT